MAHPDTHLPKKAVDAFCLATAEANRRIFNVAVPDYNALPEDEKERCRAVARAGLKAFLNAWI